MSLLVCLDVNVRATCVARDIAHSPLASLQECYGPVGQTIVIHHLANNPIRPPWKFGGIQCTWGNGPKPARKET